MKTRSGCLARNMRPGDQFYYRGDLVTVDRTQSLEGEEFLVAIVGWPSWTGLRFDWDEKLTKVYQ